MKSRNLDVSPLGIAHLYKDVCSAIIIHETDSVFKKEIEEETSLEVIEKNILFTNQKISEELASFILKRR